MTSNHHHHGKVDKSLLDASVLSSKVRLGEDDTDMKEFLDLEKMSGNGDISEVNRSRTNLLSKRLHDQFQTTTEKVLNDSLFDPDVSRQLITDSPKRRIRRLKSEERMKTSQSNRPSPGRKGDRFKLPEAEEVPKKKEYSSSRHIAVRSNLMAGKNDTSIMGTEHDDSIRVDMGNRDKLCSPKLPTRDIKVQVQHTMSKKAEVSMHSPIPQYGLKKKDTMVQVTTNTALSHRPAESKSTSNLKDKAQAAPALVKRGFVNKGRDSGASREASLSHHASPSKLLSSKSMGFDFSNKDNHLPVSTTKIPIASSQATQKVISSAHPTKPTLATTTTTHGHHETNRLSSPNKKLVPSFHHSSTTVTTTHHDEPTMAKTASKLEDKVLPTIKARTHLSHLLNPPGAHKDVHAHTKPTNPNVSHSGNKNDVHARHSNASAKKSTEDMEGDEKHLPLDSPQKDQDFVILKKASFNLIPDIDSEKNLVSDTFEDVMVGKSEKTSARNPLSARKMITPEEALSQLTAIIREHFELRKEKVIVEMLYLEQFVKKYKMVMLSNLDVCLRQALSDLKESSWESISKFKLDTFNLSTTHFETVKRDIKKIYTAEKIDFTNFRARSSRTDVSTLEASATSDIVEILKQFKESEEYLAEQYKKNPVLDIDVAATHTINENTMELTGLGSDLGGSRYTAKDDEEYIPKNLPLHNSAVSPVHKNFKK